MDAGVHKRNAWAPVRVRVGVRVRVRVSSLFPQILDKSLTNPSSLEPSFASRWSSSSSLAELRSSPHLSFAWSSPHPHMDTLSTCASLIAQCTPADTCIGAHVHASLQTNENMPVYDPLLILVTRLTHALLSAPGAGLRCQQEACLHSSWHPNSSL